MSLGVELLASENLCLGLDTSGSYRFITLEPLSCSLQQQACLVPLNEVRSSGAGLQLRAHPPLIVKQVFLLKYGFGETSEKRKGANSPFYCHGVINTYLLQYLSKPRSEVTQSGLHFMILNITCNLDPKIHVIMQFQSEEASCLSPFHNKHTHILTLWIIEMHFLTSLPFFI